MPAMTHPQIGGELGIDAPPDAVPIYEASGWRLTTPPEGHQPAGAPPPVVAEGALELVAVVRPEGGLEASVPVEALDHLRPAGWMTVAQHQANQEAAAKAEEAAAAAKAKEDEAAAKQPKARAGTAAKDDEPAGTKAGEPDKED